MKILHSILTIALVLLFSMQAKASNKDIVMYAGGAGNDTFNDVIQLSDGTFLICGGTDDLDWVKASPNAINEISEICGLENKNSTTGRYAFFMQVSADFSKIIRFVHLPKGAAEDIRFMKTTNVPGEATGDLYISGTIDSYIVPDVYNTTKRDAKVFIARLDKNFVNGAPTKFVWQHTYWSQDYVASCHPWDVRSDGKVVVAEGQSHNYDFGAIYMLSAETGEYCIVPKWRNHRYVSHRLRNDNKQRDDFIEYDYWGMPEDYEPDLTVVEAYQRDSNFEIMKDENGNPIVTATGYNRGPLIYSRIYTKWTGSADLRSWTQEDYDLWQEDENGSYKKGKYPWDMMFSGPCNPNDIGGSTKTNEYGYTRYRTQGGSKAIFGTSSITVDRRNNDLYIGMNVSSKLPDGGLPDFEPVVIAYTHDGEMKWWSRLYHETVNGNVSMVDGKLVVTDYQTNTSTPDQYVDGIAVDYSKPASAGEVIVNARCHGNNVENFWEGNTVVANPGGNGFKNGYSGNGGDMHLGWLGRMSNVNGKLMASTYVAEAADDAQWGSSVLSDPNLDGWYNPNDGWLKLTTTRVVPNTVKVSASGMPMIIGTGRRTITTTDANQKMYKPEEGRSSWNMFARVYKNDLSLPVYSSLATGVFGLDGENSGNMTLMNFCKTRSGVIAIGKTDVDKTYGEPKGNDANLGNIPVWGKEKREKQDGVIFYFMSQSLECYQDGYDAQGSGIDAIASTGSNLALVGNCIDARLSDNDVKVYDVVGNLLIRASGGSMVNVDGLVSGIYIAVSGCNVLKFKK